jgi:Tfp pilus assembly protein PilV
MNYIEKKINGEEGFSYIDVMIAVVICMIGVLAMTGALVTNLIRSHSMENQAVAKQLATSALESVFSARDIARVGGLEGWDSVGNVGSNVVAGVPRGVFMTGWRPVRVKSGADGVTGTVDDACNAPANCLGNANNPILQKFERQITVTDINDTNFSSIKKRRITIEVRYKLQNIYVQEAISSIIADYR